MSKKKKKSHRQAIRAQKAAVKRRAREKLVAKRERQGSGRAPVPIPGLDDFVRDGSYLRWLAHGTNFFASDYKEGTWSPVFPDLYDGNLGTHAVFRKRLMDRYWNAKTKEWVGPVGQVIVAWATVTPEPAYVFYLECIRLLGDAEIEDPFETVWEPHNGIVWEFLNKIRERLAVKAISRASHRKSNGSTDTVEGVLEEPATPVVAT